MKNSKFKIYITIFAILALCSPKNYATVKMSTKAPSFDTRLIYPGLPTKAVKITGVTAPLRKPFTTPANPAAIIMKQSYKNAPWHLYIIPEGTRNITITAVSKRPRLILITTNYDGLEENSCLLRTMGAPSPGCNTMPVVQNEAAARARIEAERRRNEEETARARMLDDAQRQFQITTLPEAEAQPIVIEDIKQPLGKPIQIEEIVVKKPELIEEPIVIDEPVPVEEVVEKPTDEEVLEQPLVEEELIKKQAIKEKPAIKEKEEKPIVEEAIPKRSKLKMIVAALIAELAKQGIITPETTPEKAEKIIQSLLMGPAPTSRFTLEAKRLAELPSIRKLISTNPTAKVSLPVVIATDPNISKKPAQIVKVVDEISKKALSTLETNYPKITKQLANIDPELPRQLAVQMNAQQLSSTIEGAQIAFQIDFDAILKTVDQLAQQRELSIPVPTINEVKNILQQDVQQIIQGKQPFQPIKATKQQEIVKDLNTITQVGYASEIIPSVDYQTTKALFSLQGKNPLLAEEVSTLFENAKTNGMLSGFNWYTENRNSILEGVINTPAVKALLPKERRQEIVDALQTPKANKMLKQNRTEVLGSMVQEHFEPAVNLVNSQKSIASLIVGEQAPVKQTVKTISPKPKALPSQPSFAFPLAFPPDSIIREISKRGQQLLSTDTFNLNLLRDLWKGSIQVNPLQSLKQTSRRTLFPWRQRRQPARIPSTQPKPTGLPRFTK